MNTPKLYIPPKKYTGESTVVSMRMPKDMIEEIDRVAKATGRTRSELMTLFVEFAMKHMEIGKSRTGTETAGDFCDRTTYNVFKLQYLLNIPFLQIAIPAKHFAVFRDRLTAFTPWRNMVSVHFLNLKVFATH